jgi:hypothetical protein
VSGDVDREALHDWLDERDGLAADERPSRAELAADERFDCPGCPMCGAAEGDPCECFDPQEGP